MSQGTVQGRLCGCGGKDLLNFAIKISKKFQLIRCSLVVAGTGLALSVWNRCSSTSRVLARGKGGWEIKFHTSSMWIGTCLLVLAFPDASSLPAAAAAVQEEGQRARNGRGQQRRRGGRMPPNTTGNEAKNKAKKVQRKFPPKQTTVATVAVLERIFFFIFRGKRDLVVVLVVVLVVWTIDIAGAPAHPPLLRYCSGRVLGL